MLTATKKYLDLVARFPLRPIERDEELDAAIAVVDSLLAKPRLSKDEDDYLDVLGDLIRKYEKSAHPIEPASDSEMLKHLLESRDFSQIDLHKATGIAISTISAILSGKRRLSRRHIAALSAFFHVSADSFAAPTPTPRGKPRAAGRKATPARSQRSKALKRPPAARRKRR
ncbi:MAG TPA: helix-turn-helix domain-containing protein [Thermomicrobiales bacterium]|nr:helix-turn-helix domain-containing protein [Thermomicrobiales bacterium]